MLESELFRELREFISGHLFRIQRTAGAVARLDVFASFAESAMQNGFVRPMVDLSGVIHIEDGRHPVVEQLLDGGQFVANSLYLDRGENTVAITTGPNMAGKSTYMRQCALIVLMAQGRDWLFCTGSKCLHWHCRRHLYPSGRIG